MRTKIRAGVSAILLLSILGSSGCQTVESTPNKATVAQEENLLDCAARIRAMSTAELQAEGETLQKAWAARRNEDNRMRLALFLTLAPPPHGDRARALTLFDVPPSEPTGRGRNHPLAQVLLPLLQDYRRLDEAVSNQQSKLRELALANEQMRQKLDALREIETQLLERPKTK